MSCKITGIGVVGAFGTSLKEMVESVTQAESRPELLSWHEKHHMPVFKAKTGGIAEFFPKNLLRRTDHFSKMALLAASLAIQKYEEREKCSGDDTGIIVATGYGSIASTCRFKDSVFASEDKGPSPLLFSRSVHNQAASHLAILLSITGPNLTVSQHYLSFHSAIQTACLWLAERRVKRVLVGGIDEFDTILAYSRKRFIKNNMGKYADPALQDHNSIPGEGAGFFLLEENKRKKGSTLKMPVIGRVTQKSFERKEKLGKTICYDYSRSEAVMDKPAWLDPMARKQQSNVDPTAATRFSDKQDRQTDPRRFYGEFPTAAALDLAFALATTPTGQSVSCIQITREKCYGVIQTTATQPIP